MQSEFFVFFAVVLGTVCLVRNHRTQKLLLLLASYYFYAWWDWRFLGLIVLSTLVDYGVGLGLASTHRPGRRRALLLLSLAVNLGILGFFKYFDFFVESLATPLAALGLHVGTLDLILPIGISFYTFQTLSYSIDVYRGRLAPRRDLGDFALFVSFFPQLVAGPIVRASEFLPQLDVAPQRTWSGAYAGFKQFIVGMAKKVVLADTLAWYVDEVFAGAGAYDGLTTWLAVSAYACQIYLDFSGYSDMAIGCARMLGYRFQRNFDFPYVSRSMSEFWTRWHISLSSWLRDYLYIPLGGNRRGRLRTQWNLLLTMLLGGLWHGAAWTFVFWGGFHGAALIAQRGLSRWLPAKPSMVLAGVRWLAVMLVVWIGWVFFRAESFAQGAVLVERMAGIGEGVRWLHPLSLVAMLVVVSVHAVHLSRFREHLELRWERWYSPLVLCTLMFLVIVFWAQNQSPFIYFQF